MFFSLQRTFEPVKGSIWIDNATRKMHYPANTAHGVNSDE